MKIPYLKTLILLLLLSFYQKPAHAFQQFPCGMIHTVSSMFLEYHIVHNSVDKKIRDRVSDEFLSRLDPQ